MNGDNQKNGNELVITRVFHAPLEKVWKAWTEPEYYKKWWGPKGFTSPEINIDFRPGGKFLGCMRSPEGEDFWSTGEYIEIVHHEKIVSTDSFSDSEGNIVPATEYGMGEDFPLEMQVVSTFEEENGKTKYTLRHIGMPAGEMMEQAKAGWNESFDKLDQVLKEM